MTACFWMSSHKQAIQLAGLRQGGAFRFPTTAHPELEKATILQARARQRHNQGQMRFVVPSGMQARRSGGQQTKFGTGRQTLNYKQSKGFQELAKTPTKDSSATAKTA